MCIAVEMIPFSIHFKRQQLSCGSGEIADGTKWHNWIQANVSDNEEMELTDPQNITILTSAKNNSQKKHERETLEAACGQGAKQWRSFTTLAMLFGRTV